MSGHLTVVRAEPDGSPAVLKLLAEGRKPKRLYPARRPWDGHSPDCPKPRDVPVDRCRFCRSEVIGKDPVAEE